MLMIEDASIDELGSGIIVGDTKRIMIYLKSIISIHDIRVIGVENGLFTVDLAKKAIKESLISSYQKKFIVLHGKQFREEAQNALLKSLEEPPVNIYFIILVSNKTSLLPTVLSRMPIYGIKDRVKYLPPVDVFSYKELSEKTLVMLLMKHKRIGRDELKKVISDIIVIDGLSGCRSFNGFELDKLTKCLTLLHLNSNANNILTLVLSLILENNRRRIGV